jgi:hypothetical protein
MTLVVDKFRTLIPPRSKSGPGGWTIFNAPCCHHRGESADTRTRGGVMFEGSGIVYKCFNCKFTTGWSPGWPIGEKLKTLVRWMGGNEGLINAMIFDALKTERADFINTLPTEEIKFAEKSLPDGAMSIAEWLNSAQLPDVSQQLSLVIDYIYARGFDPLSNNFYWSPSPGLVDRVIVPFWYEGKLVGNTARKIKDGKPKYLSDQPPYFVFNFDCQADRQAYLFVTEGPFDALSINGVALLTNDISDQQSRIINSIGAEVIVIPDQDAAGIVLFDKAAELNWSIAMPTWEDDVKDVADAVARYGKLFVAVDAIKTAEKGLIKIQMAKNRQQHKIKRIAHDNENN